jgi:hypothetical protein
MSKHFMSYKIFKIRFLALLGLGLLVSQTQAAITINVAAEKLKDSGGLDMAVSGIIILVADADVDGFSGPSDTALVQDDDVLVFIWDIAGTSNTPGAFLGSTGAVSFSGAWDAGDPLRIYWFPTLVAASPITATTSAAAIPYGMFEGTAGVDESDAWVTPADGPTVVHDLNFITTDATVLPAGGPAGTSPATAGEAMSVTPGTAPLAPTDVAGAADGPGKIVVTWTDNATDETGYRVERTVKDSGVWSIIATLGAGVSMVDDTTVAFDTTYMYRVIALRGASVSDYGVSADVASESNVGRLANLSARTNVGLKSAGLHLVGGFFVTGGPRDILIRSTLTDAAKNALGVENTLDDPELLLEQFQFIDGAWQWVEVGSNSSWESDQAAEITASGLAPNNAVDPAVLLTLQEGLYSASITGAGDTTGISTVEVYEQDGPDGFTLGRLANLSARNNVGLKSAGLHLVGGFFVTGGERDFLLRSTLTDAAKNALGVENTLDDPELLLEQLQFIDGAWQWVEIGSNSSWESDQQAEILASGLAPNNAVDPALLVTLQEGLFSASITGAGDTTGISTIEIYEQ